MSGSSRLVVIGGGTGFIGTALKKALKLRGYDVLLVSRKPGPLTTTWSELEKSGLPESTMAVVNLAGQNILDPWRRWTTGFKQNVYASRINTTRFLASAIENAAIKPKVFVSTSGVGFYEPSHTIEYNEASPGGNFDFLSELCKDWEDSASLPEDMGVRNVKIRCGVVLGRQGGMIERLFPPFYFGLGGPVGTGDQALPWIHIDDITNLYIFSIENEDLSGVVNGVAPEIITNKEFTKSFAKALRRPAIFPLPIPVLNLMFSAERAKVMTEGQRVVSSKTHSAGFEFKYPDIDSATKQCSNLIPVDV